MLDFKEFLEAQTGKKGIKYHGNADAETSKTLKAVNETWCKYDFVLTNSKITVGVNYDEIEDSKMFDLVFVSLANFSMERDVIQSSRRCRQTKEKLIKFTFFDKRKNTKNYKNESILCENFPIYNKLVKDVLIERRAPLQETSLYLSKKQPSN